MVGVSVADNPSNYYRIYLWVRKRKWWWYIYLGMLLSFSQIHTLSTYALITCTVLQGNIDNLIVIQEVNSMCMDKSGKYIAEEFRVQPDTPAPTRKKIGLVFISLDANNDTRQRTSRTNQHQNLHNLQRKEMLMTITWPLMGTFTLSQTK